MISVFFSRRTENSRWKNVSSVVQRETTIETDLERDYPESVLAARRKEGAIKVMFAENEAPVDLGMLQPMLQWFQKKK